MDSSLKERLIESVKARLDDEKKNVRYTAIRALSIFKETVGIAVPLLVETAIEGEKLERSRAIDNLIAVGEEAVPEVIEKLVNHEDDQDARLTGIGILTAIYENDEAKESATGASCDKDRDDPHRLGPIMRRALVRVIREALSEEDQNDSEAQE